MWCLNQIWLKAFLSDLNTHSKNEPWFILYSIGFESLIVQIIEKVRSIVTNSWSKEWILLRNLKLSSHYNAPKHSQKMYQQSNFIAIVILVIALQKMEKQFAKLAHLHATAIMKLYMLVNAHAFASVQIAKL